MTITTERSVPRALIAPELHEQLTARIQKEHPDHAHLAERIVDQSLAFLVACAATPGLRPSSLVDIGWHALILHTREYADLCQRVAGRFIHHRPDELDEQIGDAAHATTVIGATVEAIRSAGLEVDAELWIPASECSQCYAGCVDDPKREV
jgi:hypothetical protein